MTTFAKGTEVSVEKSKAEIEGLLSRYGANKFASGWDNERAYIVFECKDRQIRFTLRLPAKSDKQFTHWKPGGGYYEKERPEADAYKKWEQACREKWRALALVVKAKLKAVSSGISTFEEEFLAHILTPGGKTVGERTIPELAKIYQTGEMPKLLGP